MSIWVFMRVLCRCENLGVAGDFRQILDRNLLPQSDANLRQSLVAVMAEFILWLKNRFPKFLIQGRDVMSWIKFINQAVEDELDSLVIMTDKNVFLAYLHGTLAVFESAVRTGNGESKDSAGSAVITDFLSKQLESGRFGEHLGQTLADGLIDDDVWFGMQPFAMHKSKWTVETEFCLTAGRQGQATVGVDEIRNHFMTTPSQCVFSFVVLSFFEF